MQVYRNDAPVTVTVPYQDVHGNVVAPQSATYRVLDETGAVVVDATAVPGFDPNASGATITVSAIHNALADGEVRGARRVELSMTLADGTVVINSVSYIIEAPIVLVVNENSYQTYEQAEITALDIPNLSGWESASVRDRKAALIDAHHRLGTLHYEITYPDALDRIEPTQQIFDINALTAAELQALDAGFLKALRKAQVVEADTILGGDPIAEQRAGGLMSSSVGEVSQMYRPGKPLILAVSPRALRYLKGYIRFTVNVGRAS